MWSELLRREICRYCYQTLDHGLDLMLLTEVSSDCSCSVHRGGWAIVAHLACRHCGQCAEHGPGVQLFYGVQILN